MALDGMYLHFIAQEIKRAAVGARVEKVHQPSKEELVLVLRGRNRASRLLISSRANSPKIHFAHNAPENPQKPPMLCMLLRKHLTSALLRDVRQAGLDRVLFLDFDATNEIGDRVSLTLCVEIMAQHSNIILLNGAETVLDAVRRVDLSTSSFRQIMPGLPYRLPPAQDKINLLEDTADAVTQRVIAQPEKPLSSALLSCLQGASPTVCREIASRTAGNDCRTAELREAELEALCAELASLSALLRSGEPMPCIVKDNENNPVDFSFMPITQFGTLYSTVRFESASEVLEDFYAEKDRADRSKQYALDLRQVVAHATQRIAKKLDLQRCELQKCADREQLRVMAELIAANLYRLQNGSLFYDLENYYDNNNILRIPANPALTPQANSQKYYKDYRKAKTAEQMLGELIEQGEAELQYMETVADALERASTSAEFGEIRAELARQGYIKTKGQKAQKQPKQLPPIEYLSSDGFKILVGRNNEQNDRLSLKTAKSLDMWLHTQKIPGSHVIIVSEGREIPDSTLLEAASIAALNSKAAAAPSVPVDYTLAKNLKKPPGAKPGKVIYHVYNTVLVKPQGIHNAAT